MAFREILAIRSLLPTYARHTFIELTVTHCTWRSEECARVQGFTGWVVVSMTATSRTFARTMRDLKRIVGYASLQQQPQQTHLRLFTDHCNTSANRRKIQVNIAPVHCVTSPTTENTFLLSDSTANAKISSSAFWRKHKPRTSNRTTLDVRMKSSTHILLEQIRTSRRAPFARVGSPSLRTDSSPPMSGS